MCIVTDKEPIMVDVPLSGKATCSIKCPDFLVFSGVCEHCLAGAEFLGRLNQLLSYHNNKTKTTVTGSVYKRPVGAGRKGSKPRQGVNTSRQQPILSVDETLSGIDHPKPFRLTSYFHNNNPFSVVFLKDYPHAKKCNGCSAEFPRGVVKCIPLYDIVIAHQERYLYPDDTGEWVPTKNRERNAYYCVDKKCILPRFWNGLVKVDENVKKRYFKHL
jgi:hypothetical protein